MGGHPDDRMRPEVIDCRWYGMFSLFLDLECGIMPKKKEKPRADELEFLRWFYCNADFGPADSDVRNHLCEQFEKETKKRVPEGYEPEDEE